MAAVILLHAVTDFRDGASDLQLLAEQDLHDEAERQALVLGSMRAGVQGEAMAVENAAQPLSLVL